VKITTGDRLDRRNRHDRHIRRLREIASVAVRYGLADQLRNMPGKHMQQWLRGSAGQNIVELSHPVRIRLALTELGTTFIKFGQMLSTRADLVTSHSTTTSSWCAWTCPAWRRTTSKST
jgi:ubiquinone biosynthesis protein